MNVTSVLENKEFVHQFDKKNTIFVLGWTVNKTLKLLIQMVPGSVLVLGVN